MNESMLERLKTMENRYEELGHMLMDPDIGSDIKKMTDVTKNKRHYKQHMIYIKSIKRLKMESKRLKN